MREPGGEEVAEAGVDVGVRLGSPSSGEQLGRGESAAGTDKVYAIRLMSVKQEVQEVHAPRELMPRRCRVVAGFEPCDVSSSTDETVLLPVPLNPKPPTIASLADVSKLETDELLLVDEMPLNAEPYEDTSVGGQT